jgi:hypothetical protein
MAAAIPIALATPIVLLELTSRRRDETRNVE